MTKNTNSKNKKTDCSQHITSIITLNINNNKKLAEWIKYLSVVYEKLIFKDRHHLKEWKKYSKQIRLGIAILMSVKIVFTLKLIIRDEMIGTLF